jgi:hypothetical protein
VAACCCATLGYRNVNRGGAGGIRRMPATMKQGECMLRERRNGASEKTVAVLAALQESPRNLSILRPPQGRQVAVLERRLMTTEDMVDAALAGLDVGEFVTIPSLSNVADRDAFKAARKALTPQPLVRPTRSTVQCSQAGLKTHQDHGAGVVSIFDSRSLLPFAGKTPSTCVRYEPSVQMRGLAGAVKPKPPRKCSNLQKGFLPRNPNQTTARAMVPLNRANPARCGMPPP